MTAPARPLPGPFAAAFAYAARVSVPPKRLLLLALPCAATVVLGLISSGLPEHPGGHQPFDAVTTMTFALVVPLACLVIGDAVLGAEVRTGTFALTWLSPCRFSTIVLARWLAGWLIAAAALLVATTASAVVAGHPERIGSLAIAVIAGSGAYVALFVLVGATVRRAALWSLAIVLLVEDLLGAVLSGIAQLSPQWLGAMAYAGLADREDTLREGMPTGGGAVVRLVVLGAVFLVIAVRRIRRLRLVGAGE
jgi:hypothetical protein